MSKYLADCDSEFEDWWKENGDEVPRLLDKDAARMAFEAGANMERCEHNNTAMAKSRDWCHDCHSWLFRDE